MLDIIKGANDWEFVVVTDEKLDETIEYVTHREKTAIHIIFGKCSNEIISKICEHKNAHLIQAINVMNEGGEIDKLGRLSSLKNVSFGFASGKFDFSQLRNLEAIGGV